MRKNFLKIWAVLFFVCFLASKALAADFSADMISTVGKVTTQSKIYASGNKIRMDMKEGIMIIRVDQQVSWMLMPSEKMYMENPIDTSRVPQTSKNFNSETERVSLGAETVDGQQAEKFKITYTDNGKTESVYQWLVNQEIPVKVAAIDGSWSTEYKSLVVGAQPADLFEVPSDYSKMDMPSLGSMMGMGGH